MMRRFVGWAATLVIVAVLLVLVGCGGGGESTGTATGDTGQMKFTVVFPPLPQGVQPAVIYGATNSITIDILETLAGPNVVPQVILNRPAPEGGQVTTTIEDIPVGQWFVLVQAWSLEGGAGKLVSRVWDTVTILIGQTTSKGMVMEGYPFSLQLNGPDTVLCDSFFDVFVTPLDADGNVLLGTYEYEWSSSNDNILTPDAGAGPSTAGGTTPTGSEVCSFYAVARGLANVQCRLIHMALDSVGLTQAEVSASKPVTVNPNVDEVTITPNAMEISSGDSDTAVATAKYNGVVVPDVDFTFTSSNPTCATTTKLSADTVQVNALKGGLAGILVTQPYTSAEALLEVTVPEGGLEVIISGRHATD